MADARAPDRLTTAAHAYEQLWAPVLLPHGKLLVDALPLGRSKRVLDIATGCGTLLPYIRDAAAPGAYVLGVDISRAMVTHAPPGFSVAVMDASELALATGSFDAAVMAFGLFFVPDVPRALREVRRVVKRGGIFGLTSWFGEADFPAYRIWDEEIARVGAPRTRWAAEVLDPLSLRTSLERAGFDSARVWSGRFDHPHDRTAFLELRLGMAPWYAALPDAARGELHGRLSERLGALPDEGYLDRTPILFATAT